MRCGAERALLAALDATCHSPVAALATIDGDTLTLRAELFAEDGGEHVAGRRRRRGRASVAVAARPGAADLLDRAPPRCAPAFGG